MSRVSFKNKLGGRAIAAALCAASLCACAHQLAPEQSGTPIPGSNKVGFVRMDALVKVHPLYAQLSHLDEDVQALQLRSVGQEVAHSGSDIAKESAALQAQLKTAADATNKALNAKQQEYQKREQDAINAALAAAGVATGPGGGQIGANIAAVSKQQAGDAAKAAQANLDAYRKQLIAQDTEAANTLTESLNESARRSYAAKVAQFQKAEADYAYQQAQDDATQRLALRTKLTNLALDDASREDVKKQLDALDQKEADALGAMKNRDQAELVTVQKALREKTTAQLNAEVTKLRSRTLANLTKRTTDTRNALIGKIGPLNVPGPSGGAPAGVTPELNAKLKALHEKFASDYKKDATATIAQFQKTRADLSKKFADLTGADTSAQDSAAKELTALQKQRVDLYDQMVAQIGREVKSIAARRGIAVVVSEVVAPAGGVDLTPDAEKDIESLHE